MKRILHFAILLWLSTIGLAVPATWAQAGRACTTPLEVTLRDAPLDATNPAVGDRIRSDGRGTYFEDADIACDGDVYFLWGSGRTISFDPRSPSDPATGFGQFQGAGNVAIEIGKDLREMEIGEVALTTKVQFNVVSGTTRYFVQFWSSRSASSDILLRRAAANSWELEATTAHIATMESCAAKGKCVRQARGQYILPFAMQLRSR